MSKSFNNSVDLNFLVPHSFNETNIKNTLSLAFKNILSPVGCFSPPCVDQAKMLRRELSLATEFSYNSAISIPCQGCPERGPQKTAVARLSSRTTGRLHNTILQRRSQPSPASPKSECQWWSYHTPRSLMDITSKQKNIEERNIEEEAMTVVKRSKLPTM